MSERKTAPGMMAFEAGRPRKPANQQEERFGAMGLVLGVIDMARSAVPPEGATPQEALAVWAEMVEMVAADHFGPSEWNALKAEARRYDAERQKRSAS